MIKIARIIIPKSIPPIHIDKFLGQNDTPDGELGLKLGEATYMRNWRITQNLKLKKVEGYESVFTGLTGKVQGVWYGRLAGQDMFLFCNNGHLYNGNLTTGAKTDLGTLTNAPTEFIAFNNKVYLSNTHEWKSYDGTGTLTTVVGYRPKIFIGTKPDGTNGQAYENLNLLNGLKRQTFNPDGVATQYHIAEQSVSSIDFVKVDGIVKTITTDYTQNLTTGVITFVTAPITGQDTVEIGWTKGTGSRALIENCGFSMDYSGQTDSRVFLWGNANFKNRRFWSGIADGLPSAEYFPSDGYDDIGSGQYAITDIVKQYDKQKIYLEEGCRYSYYDPYTNNQVSFPSFELNDSIGNVAYGQVQIINNNPVSLYKGIYEWSSNTVRDETNAKLISQRVQDSLVGVDLSKAITFDWQKNGELWINVDSTVWVYNYFNDTWYLFDDIQATCFIEINGELYFGANGMINKFDKNVLTHNGTIFNAKWEMGFDAFGQEWITKFLNKEYVSLYPEANSSALISIITNNEGLIETEEIFYKLSTFEHMNFNNFSFDTSYNPQPKITEIQANGFVYIKMVIENVEATTATILSITLPARLGGKVS